MPWYRSSRDYFFGATSADITISGTTLTSSAFSALGTAYDSNYVLPLTLHDQTLGVYEVVYVTAHSASSTSVTVQRAREGSTARAWTAGTAIVCAPTARDIVDSMPRASLPSDAHTGQRAALTDEGLVVQRTITQGWQADVGVAVPGEFGRTFAGAAISNSSAILLRGDHETLVTNGSGKVTCTYRVPFPAGTATAVVSCGEAIVRPDAATASTLTVQCINATTGAPAAGGLSVTVWYIAAGY